jgi:hypothetical protein
MCRLNVMQAWAIWLAAWYNARTCCFPVPSPQARSYLFDQCRRCCVRFALLRCAVLCCCRIAQQEVWLTQQVAAHPSDPFWQVVGLLQAQLDGLYEGYAAAITAAQAAGQQTELLTRDDVLFLNSNGEG